MSPMPELSKCHEDGGLCCLHAASEVQQFLPPKPFLTKGAASCGLRMLADQHWVHHVWPSLMLLQKPPCKATPGAAAGPWARPPVSLLVIRKLCPCRVPSIQEADVPALLAGNKLALAHHMSTPLPDIQPMHLSPSNDLAPFPSFAFPSSSSSPELQTGQRCHCHHPGCLKSFTTPVALAQHTSSKHGSVAAPASDQEQLLTSLSGPTPDPAPPPALDTSSHPPSTQLPPGLPKPARTRVGVLEAPGGAEQAGQAGVESDMRWPANMGGVEHLARALLFPAVAAAFTANSSWASNLGSLKSQGSQDSQDGVAGEQGQGHGQPTPPLLPTNYPCGLCNQSFSTPDALAAHRTVKHRQAPSAAMLGGARLSASPPSTHWPATCVLAPSRPCKGWSSTLETCTVPELHPPHPWPCLSSPA
ncbi:hypothetical protein HaLaN_12145 [Haematococcus lacustris]|uniref:C2H2-type domain-containing protein n=1 Tax=Haematococcus lacustris TaxID=44745 RepID=A0A699Z9N0_HAELA|nr:hypothetical protein HaLaN_12145 [Haematococcus lacustris]